MIKPIMEKILVRQLITNKTDSGLIIPDNVKQEKRGIIVAVGDGDVVNGQLVPIVVKVGDVVQVRERSRKLTIVMESLQKMERDVPSYLQLDKDTCSIKFAEKPAFAEVPYPVEMQPHFITEYYSR